MSPLSYQEFDAPDTMIHIEVGAVDLLVTPEHRILSLTRDNNAIVEEAESWTRYKPNQIVDRKFVRGGRKPASYEAVLLKHEESDAQSLRQAVAIQADGWMRPDGKCELAVKSSRKKNQLKQLFGECVTVRGKDRLNVVLTTDHPAFDWIELPSKVFKEHKILSLSLALQKAFLDEIFCWDGDFTRKCTFLQHEKRKRAVDLVQAIAILLGHSTSPYKKIHRGEIFHCVNLHRKSIRYASKTNVIAIREYNKHSIGKKVYCVTVPTGFIVIRRNNKSLICGNCQNIPVRESPEYRDCIIAAPGNVIIGGDYAQQEIRTLAYLSKDENLLKLLNEDGDIYEDIAKEIGKTRRETKDIVLGILYGMSPYGLAKMLGVDKKEAEAIIYDFFQKFYGVYQWSLKQENRKTFVTTAYGRRCWLNPYNAQHKRNAINNPNQGSAADMTKMAIAIFHKEWRKTFTVFPLILQIHDELVAEVKEEFAEFCQGIMESSMLMAGEKIIPGIPVKVEVKIGKKWSDVH